MVVEVERVQDDDGEALFVCMCGRKRLARATCIPEIEVHACNSIRDATTLRGALLISPSSPFTLVPLRLSPLFREGRRALRFSL